MTDAPKKSRPARVRALVAEHQVLAAAPYSNWNRMREVEREIGVLVAAEPGMLCAGDWAALTPTEVWSEITALNAARLQAPKIAGPWQVATGPAYNGHTYEWRPMAPEAHDGRLVTRPAVWVGPNDTAWDEEVDGIGYFDTRDEADAALRATGWLLLDELETA